MPFTACLAMLAVPEGEFVPAKRRGRYAPAPPDRHRHAGRGWLAYAPVALVFAVSVPVAAWGMSLPRYAPQEYALGAVLAPDPDRRSARNGGRAPHRGDLLHRT